MEKVLVLPCTQDKVWWIFVRELIVGIASKFQKILKDSRDIIKSHERFKYKSN